MEANKTVKVFCSYAHGDEIWFRELETHLSLPVRQGLLTLWHHQLISPGTNWEQAINTHLETANVILLLVSANFLASDYCYGIEMKRALERHQSGEAQVIPILIRQVDWKHAPFAHLRILPTDAQPLALWADKDAALAHVSESLRRVIEGESLPGAGALRPATLSIWNVPHRRNPHFTGRDKLLDQLQQRLTPIGQSASAKAPAVALTQPQAIKGLGGIGKTQIAVEYAYRSRDLNCYTDILWINAATEEAVITSFTEIAKLLPLFAADDEMDQHRLAEAIKHWLEQREHCWLVIFDNADDLSLVHKYIPQRGNGSILLTTRASAVGSLAASIEVDNMGLTEGTQFLLHRAQRLENASDEESNEAMNVVIALDAFALALDQAGAYIEETGCSFFDYLNIYRDHRQTLLARRGLQATNYPDAVATTWSLSFQKVEQANPAAAELLVLCAFLAPDKIPEELIRDGATHWSPPLQEAAADRFAFNQMVEELLKFSLVQRLTETQTLSIHRLVQTVLLDRMDQEVQSRWAKRVVLAVNDVFPLDPDYIPSWPRCRYYLSQVQACFTLIEHHSIIFIEAANLLKRAAVYMQHHVLYAVAESLILRAISIYKQALGNEHFDTVSSIEKLADLYRIQGKYSEAEALYRRVLEILGSHPSIAYSLAGLADLYRIQGKYSEAESFYQHALSLSEQVLGTDHFGIAHMLVNLASCYGQHNKDIEAEALYRRALSIYERHQGTQGIASCLSGLAHVYHNQRKYAESELLYQQALKINEAFLEADDPLATTVLDGLARLYCLQRRFAEAEPLYQRVLSIREKQFGIGHFGIAYSLNCLAGLYYFWGKYEEAEPLYQRALSMKEKQWGGEHSHVAQGLNNLAMLYKAQGRYVEAEPLYRRALSIREKHLGSNHPDTASSLNDLAEIYCVQGEHANAEPLLLRSLEINEQQLGPLHSNVAADLKNLATLYSNQGKCAEAEPLYRRALHILEQNLGPEHPQVAEVLHNLANLYLKQRKYAEAEPLYQHAFRIWEQSLGPEHPHTQIVRTNYTFSLQESLQTKQSRWKRIRNLFSKSKPQYK